MQVIDTQEPLAVAVPTAKVAASDSRPWPRYLARMLDTIVLGSVVGMILGIVLAFTTDDSGARVFAVMEGFGGMLLSNVVSFVIAAVPIAFLLSFAQTPGKWLFGIRVRNTDGSRLGLWRALQREAWVLVRGVGFALPLVTLFTMISSYTDLKDDGVTAWDRALRCEVTHAPATLWWWVRAILGGLLVLGVSLWSYVDMFMSMARPAAG